MLTNRVVLLADVALACIDAHFGAVTPDAQNVSVLFLPQVLHVLSLHVKQTLPDAAGGLQHTLVSYLLICGLAEKLRELFRRAEIRGMRLFDGASPVPLLLLRAMGFLGNLVGAFQRSTDSGQEGGSGSTGGGCPASASVLQMLHQTELFGIVNILLSILLSEGRREKSSGGAQAQRLPQTVISLSHQAVQILNNVARIDLATLQETLGACRQQELYHLLVCLVDYCNSRLQAGGVTGVRMPPGGSQQGQGQEENALLHETMVLLGYYCLQRSENQGIMCYGEGQTLITKIASLPLYYFMDDRGRSLLFPTILATCFRSEQNLELLRNEMNLSLLHNFLASCISQKEEVRQPDATGQALSSRFPPALWQEALEFFSSDAANTADAAAAH